MPPRIQHSLIVLVVLLATYAAYAVIVDPLLVSHASPVPLARRALAPPPNPLNDDLRRLFPANSWELGDVNAVTASQLCLVWKSHAPVEDRRLRVHPLTIIYRSAADPNSPRSRRTWIVRAAAGAVLQFEKSLDVAAGRFGRFHSGFIPGTVTASGYLENEMGDASAAPIEVLTNNLQFDDQRIWTADDVAFRWGQSFGSGNDLSIVLEAGDESAGNLSTGPSGAVQSVRLMRLDQLHVALPAAEDAASSPASAPVDVSAAGPLQIDMVGGTCRISEQVQVERHTFAGEVQRLRCQELLLLFTPHPNSAPPSSPDPSSIVPPLAVPRLELEEIQATGQPVVIESIEPGESGRTRRFETTEFHYRLAPGFSPTTSREDSSWETYGSAWTHGPGRCFVQTDPKSANGFTIRWQKSLTWQPIADGGVIRLQQDAFCSADTVGEMRADQLEVYLRHVAASSGTPAALQMDRLIADGNVQVRSSRLHINTQALQLNASAMSPAPSPVSHELVLGDPRRGQRPAWFSTDSGSGLQLQAEQIELEAIRSANGFDVQSASLLGRVECRELPSATGISRLLIRGSELQLQQMTQSAARMDLNGEPAIIGAESIQLTGTNIHADAGQNTIWMEGPGSALLPLPAELAAGLPPGRAQALVTWHSGLHFDGQQLQCGDGISLRGPYQLVRGETLRLSLARPIRLDELADRDRLVLATTAVDGDVFVENRSIDRTGMVSIDSARLQQLQFEHRTSALLGQGPGWVESVRRGKNAWLSAPGSPQDVDDNRLSFVHIDFEREVTGDLAQRIVHFQNQVRAIYGPVHDWPDRIEVVRPEALPEQALLLGCDRLTMLQNGRPNTPNGGLELIAQGNTTIDGRQFTATAERLSYEQAKDLLVLEGNERTGAQILHRDAEGERRSVARKLQFQPRTNRLIGDLQFLEFRTSSRAP